MKRTAKLLAVLLLISILLSTGFSCASAEGNYTIRLYAGNRGTGDSTITAAPNETVSLDLSSVTVKDDKFYVKGVAKAGYDSYVDGLANMSFPATGDADYVVVYGVKGDMAMYTVRYVSTTGKVLAPETTGYANIGETIVVGCKDVDGYIPNTYNYAKPISANEANNVFTFIYSLPVVSYTVRYLSTTGEVLAAETVGYANAGDTVIVASKAVDGYTPNAASYAITLSANENNNVYTFEYTRTGNPGQNPGENPGQNPGENPGQNPGENPGQNPGGNQGQNAGENQGQNAGENQGQNAGENQGQNAGENQVTGNSEAVSIEGGANGAETAEPGTTAGEDNGAGAAEAGTNAEVTVETVAEPQDIIYLDEQGVPLAESAIEEQTPSSIEKPLLIGASVLFVGLLALVLALAKRNKDESRGYKA